jgi:hypothetical protein
MTTLRCPACEEDRVFAQWKAYVTQGVRLLKDGSLDYDVYEWDDVESTDDKEWFTCRACGEHSESIDHFKYEEEA